MRISMYACVCVRQHERGFVCMYSFSNINVVSNIYWLSYEKMSTIVEASEEKHVHVWRYTYTHVQSSTFLHSNSLYQAWSYKAILGFATSVSYSWKSDNYSTVSEDFSFIFICFFSSTACLLAIIFVSGIFYSFSHLQLKCVAFFKILNQISNVCNLRFSSILLLLLLLFVFFLINHTMRSTKSSKKQ